VAYQKGDSKFAIYNGGVKTELTNYIGLSQFYWRF